MFINGVAATYQEPTPYREPRDYAGSTFAVKSAETIAGSRREIQFLPQIDARRNFGPVVVPADSYFVLGDNRDDSGDSRYIGFVPRRLLIGRGPSRAGIGEFQG